MVEQSDKPAISTEDRMVADLMRLAADDMYRRREIAARHRQQAYDQGRADERAAEMGRQCGLRADLNFLRLSVEDGDPKAEVLLRIENIMRRWFKGTHK